jgi:hypothetical protein
LNHILKLRYEFNVKSEGMRQLRTPTYKWDNIKMDFSETGCVVLAGIIWLRTSTSGKLF